MLWIMKDRTPGTGLALGKLGFEFIFSLVPGIQIIENKFSYF